MRKIKILIIILFMMFTCSCQKEEPKEVILKFLNETEVFSELKFFDLIKETNTEILDEDFKISTDTLGKNKYRVNYKYNNKKYKRDIVLNIIDTEKPFIYSGGNRTVTLNSNQDFCESLIFGDNYDSDPKCEIIGEYNTATIGTYNVKMKITDQSGNETEKDLTIKVVEKIETVPPKEMPRLDFSEVIAKHQSTNTEFGIDVSSWQENIDFSAVKNAGATFVMIRLGFQSSSTRELKMDNYFAQNIVKAKEAGLKVGIYLYTDSATVDEAKEHAKWVLNQLGDIKLDLPIAFDWEDFSNFRKFRLSLHDLNEMANMFIKTVEDAGYQGMLYSSKNYLENFWQNKHGYPVWLAHYTEQTNYQGKYMMWQLSNTGRIPGIAGPVDINVMYIGDQNG